MMVIYLLSISVSRLIWVSKHHLSLNQFLFYIIDVTFLASGGRDRLIHVFDASRNYQLITTLADHSAIVTAVRFTFSSITSKLGLISASADKSLIFRSISKVSLRFSLCTMLRV